MAVGADPAKARPAMTALRRVGRNRWPVTARQWTEVLVRRLRLQYRGKVRPDELRHRASLSAAVLRHVTPRGGAGRAATPCAGQGQPPRRPRPVRPWSPRAAISRTGRATRIRTRRSMRTRPALRPISPAVRSQESADPPPARPAEPGRIRAGQLQAPLA